MPISGLWVLLYCFCRGSTHIWVSPVLFYKTIKCLQPQNIRQLEQFMAQCQARTVYIANKLFGTSYVTLLNLYARLEIRGATKNNICARVGRQYYSLERITSPVAVIGHFPPLSHNILLNAQFLNFSIVIIIFMKNNRN